MHKRLQYSYLKSSFLLTICELSFAMKFLVNNSKFLVVVILVGFFSTFTYSYRAPPRGSHYDDSSEEKNNLESVHSMVKQLVSRADELREQLRNHMDKTHNSLRQLSQDVRILKSQALPRGNHLLTAINPGLSHKNRLRQCLREIPTNTDYNNSLTINFPVSQKEEMNKLLTLYNLRACILETSLEWWLSQILNKAGIPGIPKAILFEQLKPLNYEEGEEFNKDCDPNPPCLNLDQLKQKTSMIFLFPGSCVRIYSNPHCLGENRIFASYTNNTQMLRNNVDGFDKRIQSIGRCFP